MKHVKFYKSEKLTQFSEYDTPGNNTGLPTKNHVSDTPAKIVRGAVGANVPIHDVQRDMLKHGVHLAKHAQWPERRKQNCILTRL